MPRVLKAILAIISAGLVTAVAYGVIWCLIWLNGALFNGQPNQWVSVLEYVHGMGSVIIGIAALIVDLRDLAE